MAEPVYDIPPERQMLYYVGMGLTGVGFLLFLSNFCVIGCSVADRGSSSPTTTIGNGDFFQNFESMQRRHIEAERRHAQFGNEATGFVGRAVGGIILMILGGVLQNVGAHGWAGSGILLDPQKARKEREPMNRATGGMINDALEEVDVLKSLKPEQIIKVKCRSCAALNDETAKFCNQCGKLV